ncbi:MAG: uracil-DNA glycosylase [Alcaligenaceae bacterium]|nr:uracil-DNA glycosylase [Alcaligenaceae bacterium]
MSSDISPQTPYVDSLNPLQRQILTELGIDFLWGKSLASNLQQVLTQSAEAERVDTASSTVDTQTQATQQVAATSTREQEVIRSTVASSEAAQAHAQEALKMLNRARHRILPATHQQLPELLSSSELIASATPADSIQTASSQQQASPRADQSEVVQIKAISSSQGSQRFSELSWQELKVYAESCQACELAQQRQHVVFANREQEQPCDWLFIEQMPSEADDSRGQAMSAEAGALFEQMLLALDLKAVDVAVLPLLKCRPNYPDYVDEGWFSACSPILLEQIKRLKPKCIVAFGDAAASLLQENKGLLALRRQALFFEHPQIGSIPVIATFSPHYLLVNSSEKAQTWQDLKRARQIVREHA